MKYLCAVVYIIKASKIWNILRKSTCNSTAAVLTSQRFKIKASKRRRHAFNTLYYGKTTYTRRTESRRSVVL